MWSSKPFWWEPVFLLWVQCILWLLFLQFESVFLLTLSLAKHKKIDHCSIMEERWLWKVKEVTTNRLSHSVKFIELNKQRKVCKCKIFWAGVDFDGTSLHKEAQELLKSSLPLSLLLYLPCYSWVRKRLENLTEESWRLNWLTQWMPFVILAYQYI